MDLGRDSSHHGVRQSVELLYNSGFDGDESQRSGLEVKVASECNDMDAVNASRKSMPTADISRKSIPLADHVYKNPAAADHVQIEVTESNHSASSSTDHSGNTDLLDAIPASQRTTVVFTDIQAWVPLAFKAPSVAKKLKDKVVKPSEAKLEAARKQILFNISASCSPGELLALMGPSGSGKTSLLSVLGDRKPKLMTMAGSVLFNGQPMTRQVKRRMGFVLQDDLLHETLTVHETLRYIALLRLPQSMTIEEKESRAEGVMTVLGIAKQGDTLVGGRMHKGVSGGERKRVSVGAELLINPSVLFLDEPTSGLDASTALHLVETLRQLASGGRSIITTIHQPSSRLYATMDSLILLAQGHTIYFGKAALADRWFSHLGYPNPGNFNIADYVLDLASNTLPVPTKYKDHPPPGASGHLPNGTAQDWDTIGYLTSVAEAFLAKHQRSGFTDTRQLGEVKLPGESSHDLIPSVRMSNELVDVPLEKGATKEGASEAGKVQKFGASWVRQFVVLFERSIRSRRLDALNMEKFIQVFLVGLLASLFWWQVGQKSSVTALTDFAGVLFFILVFPTFGAVFTAIFTFPTEYAMLCKERGSGMYQLSSYYLARTTADLPLVILMPALFFNEVYWMAGFSYNAANYFFTFFTVFLMVITGDSAGLWLGAMAMDARRAQTFVTVFMLSQFLVAGFFVRNIPSWISWAKYLSFLYWGYSLMNKIQVPAVDVYGCSTPGVKCTLEELQKLLRTPRKLTETKAMDVFIIIGFLIFFRALTYIILKRRTSK